MSKQCPSGHEFIGEVCDRCGGPDIFAPKPEEIEAAEETNMESEEKKVEEGVEVAPESTPESTPETAPETPAEETKPEGEVAPEGEQPAV